MEENRAAVNSLKSGRRRSEKLVRDDSTCKVDKEGGWKQKSSSARLSQVGYGAGEWREMERQRERDGMN